MSSSQRIFVSITASARLSVICYLNVIFRINFEKPFYAGNINKDYNNKPKAVCKEGRQERCTSKITAHIKQVQGDVKEIAG